MITYSQMIVIFLSLKSNLPSANEHVSIPRDCLSYSHEGNLPITPALSLSHYIVSAYSNSIANRCWPIINPSSLSWNGLPCDGPGFNSRSERCIYRASRPSQGTVNGGAVSKWPRCRWDVKHNQPTSLSWLCQAVHCVSVCKLVELLVFNIPLSS